MQPLMKQHFADYRYYVGLMLLNIGLIFVLPASKTTMQAYHLSNNQYHILLFLVLLPLMLIWSAAFYGFISLHRYAHLIADTPEGKGFNNIASGMGWIAWGLPAPSILGTILNGIANVYTGFHPAAIIIANYAYVIAALGAFYYFSFGAGLLARQAKVHIDMKSAKQLTLIFVAVGTVFCYLMFSKLHDATLTNSYNAFYLPNWLVDLTLIMPYLYAWFIGFIAAAVLMLLAKRSSGILYKQALQLLASGLLIIILSLSAVQYFRAIVPRSGHLSLGGALLFIYVVYGVSVIGYTLVTLGSRKLKRIEEV